MYIINQIYGLVIAVVLLVLFTTTKRLTLKGTSSFFRTISIVILCLFFDALSCVAIRNWYTVDNTKNLNLLVEIICKTYLITMIWVGWTNFCYVCLDLNSTAKKHRRLCFVMAGVTLIMSIVIGCVDIAVVDDPVKGLFTEGPAVISTYVFALFYIFSSITVAIYVLSHRNRRRGFAVLFSHIIWIVAALVQALNNDLLLVGLAMSIGLLILYIVMENPDAYIDRSLECYSSSAFSECIDYLFEKKKDICILDISATSTSAIEGKGVDIQKEIKKIIHHVAKNRNVHIFKTFNVGIALVTENKEFIDEAIRDLIKVAEERQVSRNILILFIPSIKNVNGTYDVIKLMTYARQNFLERTGQKNEINDDFIKYFNSIEKINSQVLKALDEDRVEVFYQPIYNTKTKSFELAEALCRIRNIDGSLMSPGVFIPVSESTGSITLLGERIYNKVCDFFVKNNTSDLGVVNVDVNLSAVQCDNVELAKRFATIAKEKGISPNLISFEITETAFSSVKANMLDNMNQLISCGFAFALDDFGRGASNLMYAIEMPVNLIKLDMELTQLYMQDVKAKAVVNAIVKMAHDMGLRVVSEGVETKEQEEIITKAGIDYIQGFYFSKPLSEADYLEFLKAHQK